METISNLEFKTICNNKNTEILKVTNLNLPKVCIQNNLTVLKIFYRKKKWITSDRFQPRALRFCNNSKTLRQHGYNAPLINKIQYCKELKVHLVYYEKIDGVDIRKKASQGHLSILTEAAKYIASLHTKGIFFRSIHLENILYTSTNEFALIDLTDVRFKSKPLSLLQRYRNLKHLFTTTKDQKIWQEFGKENFLNLYFRNANLNKLSQKILMRLVKR